jgi:Sec-independent protein secretion pathway component TatC
MENYLEDVFQLLGGFKTLISVMCFILGACLVFYCLVPLIVRSVSSLIEATVERKIASYVMMPWKYKPLNQDDAL